MATVIEQAKEQMSKSVEATKENFTGIRTGRANPALLNGLTVEYYGVPTPIKAVATIGVPEPRTLAVTPYDASQANAVEKAIRDSDLGVSPRREGSVIYATMPELTEERRKDLTKLVHKSAEEAKVAIRAIRRDAMEHIKKLQKDGKITEDEQTKAEKKMQEVTDDGIKSIDEQTAKKDKEIMEV